MALRALNVLRCFALPVTKCRPVCASTNVLTRFLRAESFLSGTSLYRGHVFNSHPPFQPHIQQKRYIKPGLTKEGVTQQVLAICSDYDKIQSDKLNLDSKFINDLGLDSLDHIEIVMQIEDEFWLEIPDVDAEKLFTPRDIVNHVCHMVAKAEPIE